MLSFFFFIYLPSPNLGPAPPGLTTQMLVEEQQSLNQNTRQIYKDGPPWMCGQHDVRASAEGNTGQNTDQGHTHPIPGQKLKFLTPPRIEPGPAGWKAGTLPTTPRRRIYLYSRPRVRKSRYWGGNASVPHPLLWPNEPSLLVQWRTMNFVLTLLTLVCVRRVLSAGCQCFSVLSTRHTDVVGDSSGRSYVTEQWHNVPLLRTRVLDHKIERI